MSKDWTPRKATVELAPGAAKPSRIRRDPVPETPRKEVRPYPTEREVWTVVIGVLMFALAIVIITFQVSDLTSH